MSYPNCVEPIYDHLKQRVGAIGEMGTTELIRSGHWPTRTFYWALERLEKEGRIERSYGKVRVGLPRNLRGVDLSNQNWQGARLRGADLSGATLRGINLSQANLQGANLQRATLTGSQLQNANLKGCHAEEARFHACDLRKANLRKARLTEAELIECDLREANITAARLYRARLEKLDVRGCQVAAYLDGEEHWSAVQLVDTNPYDFRQVQYNHTLFAKILFDLVPSPPGRLVAARTEAVQFGCYQAILEDVLLSFPQTWVTTLRLLNERYQEGQLDWAMHFFFQLESLILRYRLEGRDYDEILWHLSLQCPDRVLSLSLQANLSTVLPKGLSGLGLSPQQLTRATGGMWRRDKWGENRSAFRPTAPPDWSNQQRSAALTALDSMPLSLESLTELLQQAPTGKSLPSENCVY